ncbi:hypothetical protein F5B18DRAFT_645191 [Nemania serpens]|nr:hypothetical protein F5B18DRAFT_645191 [Nemania serpens]
MLANVQGVTPLLVLYQSVKHDQFGVALSTLATLIGSLLTVFGSGLWVLNDRATFDSHVTTVANHSWNLTPSNASTAETGAARLFSDIIRGVVPLPSNVWNDLVFPNISEITLSRDSFDSRPELLSTTATNFTLTLPALRPELDCDTIPSQLINATIGLGEYEFEAKWDLPPGCYGGPNANLTYTKARNSIYKQDFPTWYGTFNDLHMGPWNISNPSNSEHGEGLVWAEVRDQADNPLGCPSIVVIVGCVNNLSHPTENNPTIFICNQKIQQVDTTVTYLGDPRNGVVSLSKPPVTNESTATYLTNGTEGIYAFNYRIEYDLTSELTPFSGYPEETRIDTFINHIIHGPTGIPREELLGPENAPKLLEAIRKLYKGYMVHVISHNFSQPIVSPELRQDTGSRIITGTVTREAERLTVDYASKLALQITLAIMVVLSAIAFRLANLRGLLPRNPCSIASVMGFLAGSKLCSSHDILPEGAEWKSLEELEESLDGYVFSLGWWTKEPISTSSGTENNSINVDQNDISQPATVRNRTRFGIDVGTPIKLGYRGKEARKEARKGAKMLKLRDW